MRYILIILVFLSVGANAQMVIKAHANYRPYASPAANLLLDDYPNAAAAYSLRKLDKDYTGSAIRVRRSNDNAESDIGFTSSGDLDTAALKTFVGANSGFVVTWYDQSGNARNATQSTAANQPRIMNAGVVDRQNGKPAIFYDGTNDFYNTANVSDWEFLHFGNKYTNFNVIRAGNVTSPIDEYFIWGTTYTLTRRGSFLYHGNKSLTHGIGSAYLSNSIILLNIQGNNLSPANTQILTYLLGDPNNSTVTERSAIATNSGTLIKNGTSQGNVAVSGAANHSLRLGTAANASGTNLSFFLGTQQEIIFYNSDQSSNRTGIENNINTHYGIY